MLLQCIFTRLSLSLLLLLVMLTGQAHADTFEKALMPGELIADHAKYENDCSQCHAKFDKTLQTRLCLECHKDVSSDVSNKTRFHGRLEDSSCRNCHTEHKGRQAHLAKLDKTTFDHSRTEFALKGAHAESRVKCAGCHAEKTKFRAASRLCNDCHKKDDQEKGHKGSLGIKCASCHTEKSWKEVSFDHEKTRFPLAGGKHFDAKCVSCHANKVYTNAPLECNSCHKKDDQEKGHKGRYSIKCGSCHTDKGWKETKFNHDVDTHYVLKGKHHQVKCDSCHLPEKGSLYQQKLSDKCISCHKKDDQEKGHKGELGEKCASCHNERGWKNSSFNHDETSFPLHDKHRDAKCESCHRGGLSGATATLKIKLEKECVACHRKDDQEKGHKGRYGNKCDSCHTEKNWIASKFDHGRDTSYPLKARHVLVKCDSCHLPEKGALYQKVKLPGQCVSCHLKDDKHKNQLGRQCESCHNEKRWQDAPYDHNKARFALTGSHVKTDCKKCHQTPAFRDVRSDCYSCHQKDDRHQRSLGTKCESCHYTGTWSSWDFDHASTRFALDGGHKKVACDACHTAPLTGRMNMTCFSCHRKDDVHNGEFSMQCERCHTAVNWKRNR